MFDSTNGHSTPSPSTNFDLQELFDLQAPN